MRGKIEVELTVEPSNHSSSSEPAPGYDPPIEIRGPTDHAAALATTRSLCRSFARMHPRAGTMIDPSDVIATLDEAGVQFVLMGAHGIGGWLGQARATRDVDLVVRKSRHKKAVRALGRRFPLWRWMSIKPLRASSIPSTANQSST